MSDRRLASCHDKAAIPLTCECTDGALDLAGVAHVNRSQFPPSDAGASAWIAANWPIPALMQDREGPPGSR